MLVILFALLLAAPSLWGGLCMDDFFHRLLLEHIPLDGVHGRRLDLFVFATGDPELGYLQKDVGIVAWWADPLAKIAFFRPLSALTHAVDYALWPERPLLMHAQNLAWFCLALFVLFKVYQRFGTATVACLSLLLYAVDDAHGFAISWLSNRNALIALTFGLATLLFHDSFRRDGRRWAAGAACAVFGAALFSGESALAVTAYLFSYAVFIDEASPKSRLLALVPYAAIVVAWRLGYAALGYGTQRSGLAIDPVNSPGAFLLAAVERWPVLLAAQFALPPADLWELYPVQAPWLKPVIFCWVIATLVGLVLLLRPFLAKNRVARFWALGAALAALPSCAQFPHDRLLFWTGVGAMGLLGEWFVAAFAVDPATLAQRPWPRARRYPTYLLIGIHLPFAILLFPLRVRASADSARTLGRAERTIPESAEVRERSVILVNPPVDAFAGYVQMQRAASHRPGPRHLRWLATGVSAVTVERIGATRLRVTPEKGFLWLKSEWMQRSREQPMPAGYEVRLSDVTITVTRLTADGRPAEIEAAFAEPLESPRFEWLSWTPEGFRPFALPRVGERTTLPKVDFYALDK